MTNPPTVIPKKPILHPRLENMRLENLSDQQTLENVHVIDASITGQSASTVIIEASKFEDCEISSCNLEKLALSDVIFKNCLLFGTDLDGSIQHRVSYQGGALSGLIISASSLGDVVFDKCKLNLANFRAAHLNNVVFEGCDLSEADFSGAIMKNVEFKGCNLEKADFSKATMSNVDLRASDLQGIKGATSLKGAYLSGPQLIGLSQTFASEIGLIIIN